MTHFDFYRIAVADPHCQDPEFLKAVEADPVLAEQWEQSKQLDQQLHHIFLQPEPSSDSKSTLLSHALPERVESKPKRFRFFFAIAASFLVAAISFAILQPQNLLTNDLASHALAHSLHGSSFAGVIDERPSITSVNYRLNPLGAMFNANLTGITWFNGCSFDGIDSLHLVFAGKKGAINVFFIPKGGNFKLESSYSNDKYKGIAQESQSAYILIVGEHDEPLEPFKKKLNSATQWNI